MKDRSTANVNAFFKYFFAGVCVFWFLQSGRAADSRNNPDETPETLCREGIERHRSGYYDQAIKELKKCLDADPGNEEALFSLIESYHCLGADEEAGNFLESAVRENPENTSLHWALAFVDSDSREYDMVKIENSLTERYSNSVFHHNRYAIIQAWRNSLTDASQFLSKRLRMDDQNSNIRLALGVICLYQGNLNKAELHLEKALKLKPELAQAYYYMGKIYVERGRPGEALKYLEKSMQLAHAEENQILESYCASTKGTIFWAADDYSKAVENFEKALKIIEDTGMCGEYDNSLLNLANNYITLSEYSKAMACLNESRDICTRMKNKAHTVSNFVLSGSCHAELSETKEAVEYYKKALELCEDEIRRAAIKIYSGNAFMNLKDYGAAESEFRESLEICETIMFKQALGEKMRVLFSDLSVFWTAVFICSDPYLSPLTSTDKYFIESNHMLALISLGDVQYDEGHFDKAISFYCDAYDTLRVYGLNRFESSVQSRLGMTYLETGEYEQAEQLGNQALKSAESVGIPMQMISACHLTAEAAKKLNRLERSRELYLIAIEQIETIYLNLRTTEQRVGLVDELSDVYAGYVDLLYMMHLKNQDAGLDAEAFFQSENYRARSLLDMLDSPQFNLKIGDDYEDKKKQFEVKLGSVLNQIEVELDLHGKGTQRYEQLNSEKNRIQREFKTFMDRIYNSDPQYACLMRGDTLKLQEVQQKVLEPGQTLVEYFLYEDRHLAFVVTKKDFHIQELEIDPSELKIRPCDDRINKETRLLERILDCFNDIDKSAGIEGIVFDEESAYLVYRKIFQPLEKYFDPGTKEKGLIIIPDGALHYLPFETLVSSLNADEKANEKKGVSSSVSDDPGIRYLAERYPVSYAMSASVLNPDIRKSKSSQEVKNAVLALGPFSEPPRYAGTGNPSQKHTAVAAGDRITHQLVGKWKRFFRNAASPLPYSDDEIRGITDLYEGSAAYYGDEATEKRVKTEAARYGYLLISGHHEKDEEKPAYCRIRLAPEGDPESENYEDGDLYAYEAFNLDLNADLAILSACSTHGGQLKKGEGIIGMTRAFLYAGADSVLVSLWPVSDESTSRFMVDFCKNLKQGLPKNKALQKARINMIRYARNENYSHLAKPFFWAPFVLVGEER